MRVGETILDVSFVAAVPGVPAWPVVGYGFAPAEYGVAAVVVTPDGALAGLFFADQDRERAALAALLARLGAPAAQESAAAAAIGARLFAGRAGAWPPLRVALRATAFERTVWTALLAIPAGATRTYGEIAAAIGRPGAARAVGGALGRNPVALLVPCHRVVGAGGAAGGYRWGLARKAAMLAAEGVTLGAHGAARTVPTRGGAGKAVAVSATLI